MNRCYSIDDLTEVFIGYPSENDTRSVSIDVSDWLNEIPNGMFGLVYSRPTENTPYIVDTILEGSKLIWNISGRDVEKDGTGFAILQLTKDDRALRSAVFSVNVGKTLDGTVSPAPPVPVPSWVQDVLTAAATATSAAESATQSAESALESEASATDSAQVASESAEAAENAKDASETAKTDAQTAANNAEESAEDSEAWAVGTREGQEVPPSDPTYHNNAKWYADHLNAYTKSETDALLDEKQDVIQDLQTIREGAVLGESAVQPDEMASAISDHNESPNAHQDIRDAIPSELSELDEDSEHRTVSDTEKSIWNAKQDAIVDLDEIRSGAELGATAVQTESDPTVPEWAKSAVKPSYTASEISDDGTTVASEITEINSKISDQATSTNKLVSASEMGDAISSVEAKQLYATSSRGSFATKASLDNATTFYNVNGTVATPTKNDVAYVLSDESHDGKSAKYVVASEVGNPLVWGFVIAFTDTTFTQAQMDAINSGITSAKRQGYDSHITNGDVHVTSTQKDLWTDHVNSKDNPHDISKEQIGLGNVDNTSDANKPISTAVQTALNGKEDVIPDLQTIREGAEAGATAVQPEAGKGLFSGDYNDLLNKPTIPSIAGLASEQYVDDAVSGEAAAREASDEDLQGQIDALVSKSDVVDVVGTYAELQAYDTSTLGANDVVKVLSDSTHGDARTYYRWSGTAWNYIGSESVGYTKAETDELLNEKQDTISDLATIRSGAAAGATAYQKQNTGIPKTDLASSVQTSLDKADSALQSVPNTYRTSAQQDVIDAGKQDTITDLDSIRSGSSAGATALQPSALTPYRTSSAQDQIDNGLQASINGKSTVSASTTGSATTEAKYITINGTQWKLSSITVDSSLSSDSTNPVQNKVINTALNGKQATISDLGTIREGASAGATAYQKPNAGIPKTDLASSVQTSLNKADSALQSYTETDPVFNASAAKNIQSSDITNWNGKANTSGTYSGLSVGYANSAGSAPASDVYSWAKQPNKPSYSAEEVGITYSNVDIGEWESLATGTFYFVYE